MRWGLARSVVGVRTSTRAHRTLITPERKQQRRWGSTGQRVAVKKMGEDPVSAIRDNVRVESQEVPDLNQLKSTDVLVNVRSAAVNWVDLLMLAGQYQHQPRFPYVPGMEYSGVVAWVGKDVREDKVRVGDEILVDGFQVGARTSGDYQQWGGFASWAVAPATAIWQKPPQFSFDQAATFMAAYETSHHVLVKRAQLQPGETVLIHGATGSTGLAAVHIARAIGAKVIATGGSDEKLAVVAEEGGEAILGTINYRNGGFKDEVKRLTDGRGVQVVFDGVGGEVSLESLRCVDFNARFCIVGWTATPFAGGGRGAGAQQQSANVLPTNYIQMKSLQVLGCPVVIHTQRDYSIRAPRLAQLRKWTAEEKIKPYVSHTFELSDAQAALSAKWNREIIGGAVVHPPACEL